MTRRDLDVTAEPKRNSQNKFRLTFGFPCKFPCNSWIWVWTGARWIHGTISCKCSQHQNLSCSLNSNMWDCLTGHVWFSHFPAKWNNSWCMLMLQGIRIMRASVILKLRRARNKTSEFRRKCSVSKIGSPTLYPSDMCWSMTLHSSLMFPPNRVSWGKRSGQHIRVRKSPECYICTETGRTGRSYMVHAPRDDPWASIIFLCNQRFRKVS